MESRPRSDGYLGECASRQLVADRQPADSRVAPEPGFLAAGEPPGGADGLRAGLLTGQLAVKPAQQLLVAEGAAGRLAVTQAKPGQPPHLVFETRRPHAVHASLDAAVELRAGHLD